MPCFFCFCFPSCILCLGVLWYCHGFDQLMICVLHILTLHWMCNRVRVQARVNAVGRETAVAPALAVHTCAMYTFIQGGISQLQ